MKMFYFSLYSRLGNKLDWSAVRQVDSLFIVHIGIAGNNVGKKTGRQFGR